MRRRKTVTSNKLKANRENSKHSTGPHSQRGKNAVKYNAITLGLFAKHVVIELCDGDNARAAFQLLLGDLHKQFSPVGTFEEWLVTQMAEFMWKLRRATRCENDLVEASVLKPTLSPFRSSGDYARALFHSWEDDDRAACKWAEEIGLLNRAESEIRENGTLSPTTYQELGPLLERELPADSTDQSVAPETVPITVDQKVLLDQIASAKELLEPSAKAAASIAQHSFSRHAIRLSIPDVDDMEKIFRYEKRMRKNFDWALQTLMSTQERRKSREGGTTAASLERGKT